MKSRWWGIVTDGRDDCDGVEQRPREVPLGLVGLVAVLAVVALRLGLLDDLQLVLLQDLLRLRSPKVVPKDVEPLWKTECIFKKTVFDIDCCLITDDSQVYAGDRGQINT